MRCDSCRRDLDDSKVNHHSASGLNSCKDPVDCHRYRRFGKFEDIAEGVIDQIIKGALIHPICAEDKDHGVVMVWSPIAKEQLAEYIRRQVGT